MLSINFIRENLELVKAAAKNKNRPVNFSKLLQLDERKRELITAINVLRSERNVIAKKGGNPEAIKKGKQIKEKLKQLETEEAQVSQELTVLLLTVPNVPFKEVPIGKSEKDNKEIKKVGTLPKFSFQPKSHIELVKLHNLASMERGSKVSGFRGYFLERELAVLHLAVIWFTFTYLVKKKFTPIIAPSLVKEFAFFGNAQFPWGKDEVYSLPKDELYLSGTAEVPVTAYFANETLYEEDLPKKFVAYSPCYRREIGSYGKDTKGLFRVHEFLKVEQVVIARASEQESRKIHQELQQNLEEVLELLGLPYRTVLMCTGDMGEPQALKVDTEAYMPYKGEYGEIASNSIMTSFQARRLNIRYKTKKDQQTEYAYTLNNTAIASPRILIAILENFQQENGSIIIPKVLQPFCGFDKIG
jgi:seryl-tRNA synthetase